MQTSAERDAQACMKLLAKEREARFQSAEDFLAKIGPAPQPDQSSSCPSCGAPLQPTDRFCSKCATNTATGQAACRCLACGSVLDGLQRCKGCGRRFSAADHRLSFRSGPLSGIAFRIPEGIFPVGRTQLSDPYVSRCHFNVACLNGSVQIQDADSVNGTFVAGQPADEPTPIISGQSVLVADNTAVYTNK